MTKLLKILSLGFTFLVLISHVLPDKTISPSIASECLTVYNKFSFSGDKTNNVFYIECVDQYPNNYLQVFNRWGTKVFDMKGYDNTWGGSATGIKTMGAERKLPIGTYYYVLDLGDTQHHQKSGWLYISK